MQDQPQNPRLSPPSQAGPLKALAAAGADATVVSPEQEAAFFYGLFLRGYTYQELRQDIEVPKEVVAQWQRTGARDPKFARLVEQMLGYRRRVLAIFQALVAAKAEPVQ